MKTLGYEITIKKVASKQKSGYSVKRWTTSETNTALRMRSEGKTTREIASMLNRTENSVNARLWKVRREQA